MLTNPARRRQAQHVFMKLQGESGIKYKIPNILEQLAETMSDSFLVTRGSYPNILRRTVVYNEITDLFEFIFGLFISLIICMIRLPLSALKTHGKL
jgi:hypothetical protein